MIPQPITINGKTGTVVYLNDLWHPVSVDNATMARVLFNDGSTGFFVVQPQESVEKFDPSQLRDEKGRWAKGSSTLGSTYLHGTAQHFLEDIIEHGIRGSNAGLIHPKDRANRTLSLPGHVYMTTDLEEAKAYAESAGVSDVMFNKHLEVILNPVYEKGSGPDSGFPFYRAGTEIGGGRPAVVTVELPPRVVKKLRKDRRSDIMTGDPYGPTRGKRVLSQVARSYKGDIKPEWITSISYATRDLATGDITWHTIDPEQWKKTQHKKAAAEPTVYYIPMVLPVQSIAEKYDPNQPRRPEGSSEGGQFAESGRSGVPTSDPELEKQAKEGIAKLEKLLPEAVRTSRHTMSSVPWEDLSEAGREKVYDLFKKDRYEMMSDEYYSTDLDDDVLVEITNDPKKQEQITSEVEKWMRLRYQGQADPASISRDVSSLKHKDGTDFTVEEKVAAAELWTSYAKEEQQRAVDEYKKTDEYAARREAGVLQSIRQQWLWMPEYKRSEFAVSMQKRGLLTDEEFSFSGQPKKWTTGVNTGTHTDADYARTHAIAERLTVMRFNDLRQERGLKPPLPEYTIDEEINHEGTKKFIVVDEESGYVVLGSKRFDTKEEAETQAAVWAVQEQANRVKSAESIIEDTWHAWKSSSSEGLGLSLQLAAAYEFGGYHRMTRGEVEQALNDAEEVGGIETLQAYVRAQWEVTQMVMKKAGEDNISVYRGLMLEGDRVKGTTNLFVDKDGKPVPAPTNITTKKTPLYSIESSTNDAGETEFWVKREHGFQEGKYVKTLEEAKAIAESRVGTKEYVAFDFNGEHFVVEKNQIPATDIRVLAEQVRTNPRTWYDVGQDVKDQVRAQWAKTWEESQDATKPLTKERSDHLQETLFQKLGDQGRFKLMHDYAEQGLVTLPKPMTLPLETNEEAIQRRIQTYVGIESTRGKVFTKLPEIALKRAGAQSTTGTMSVANEWNGVGDLPPDPKRVVLRIGAPSTSVLSLPVYGQNEQGEHETVLMGTRDKWLWDAWEQRAPEFSNITINGKPVPKKPLTIEWPDEELDYDSLNKASKSESQPLSIDLQAEDRGKPHWLSGTNFSIVLKWNESEHPRDKEGQFTDSGAVQATQSDPGAGSGGGDAISPSPTPGQARPSAVQQAYDVAQDYNAKHGLPPIKHGYVTVDERRAKAIAVAYEALPVDDSDNPAVKEAYEALSTEVQAQWDHIIASGVQMIPWTKEGQPYQNSQEMVADVQNNKRLYFFTGGEPHPLLGAIDPKTGLSMNDKFRAVHDYFGHAAGGYGFGARGEENAWISHSQMLSPKARRALTTETRGQNSFVNFGPQNYNPDGTYKHIPPGDRPFATQKVALLPDQYVF